MMVQFRIVKDPLKGYLSEVLQPRWTLIGLKWHWIPFVTYLGLPKEPYYFTTYDSCLNETMKQIKWHLLDNSGECSDSKKYEYVAVDIEKLKNIPELNNLL